MKKMLAALALSAALPLGLANTSQATDPPATMMPAAPAQATTPIDLGTPGDLLSRGKAINDNGQVTGDFVDISTRRFHAFRWTRSGGRQDLGTLDGEESSAVAINPSGYVVGNWYQSGSARAFRWTPSRGMQDLGTLPGDFGSPVEASAINAPGEVIGHGGDLGSFRGFHWTPSGGMRDIGDLGGGDSLPHAINDRGVVVGRARTATGEAHGFGGRRPVGCKTSTHSGASPARPR